VADPLPGACFLQGSAGFASDGQRLDVVVAGLAAIGGPAEHVPAMAGDVAVARNGVAFGSIRKMGSHSSLPSALREAARND
jgi:hypothetical protein